MFFDEEDDISRHLFGEREIIQNSLSLWNNNPLSISSSQLKATEFSSGNFYRSDCSDTDTMESGDSLTLSLGEITPIPPQEFVDMYCSDGGIHAILDRSSLSYQDTSTVPIEKNRNVNLEKNILLITTTAKETTNQLAADLFQNKVQRALPIWQPHRGMMNNVYCTEKGLESILITSSLSYMTNSSHSHHPHPSHSPHPNSSHSHMIHKNQEQIHEIYEEDDEYLTAFGRYASDMNSHHHSEWNKNIKQNEPFYVDPRISYPRYAGQPGQPDYGTIQPQPRSGNEGIDDYDLFNSWVFSDVEIL